MDYLDIVYNDFKMEGEKRIEIYKGAEGEVVFDVDTEGETIWASQEQMAEIFDTGLPTINYHLKNIFNTDELDAKRTIRKNRIVRTEGKRQVGREINMYNLDVIISVGYRVNSKKATQFRVWATSVLKRYLTDGVALNQRRLEALAERQEIQKLHNVENMMGIVRRLTARLELDAGEANGILEVISRYTGSFKMLEEYDDGRIDLRFMNRAKKGRELTLEMCNKAILQLKKSVKGSDLFGKKRGGGFDGSILAIFQSFDGKELYATVPEKAANLLYFVIKDHPFYDGNKRIGALLFVLFLTINDYHLTKNGETKISDRALTAIALLIAESEPKEKPLIVSLVCKLLE